MNLFEHLVLLLFVAAILLAASRRLALPYPTLLCVAGVGAAFLPFSSAVGLDPHMALAIFIAPALLDAAFDTAPRDLKHLWVPLLILAVGAVIATTAVVAYLGWRFAGNAALGRHRPRRHRGAAGCGGEYRRSRANRAPPPQLAHHPR